MSLENLTRRAIARRGRNFLVEGSLETVKGIFEENQITCSPGCGISPGDLLKDQQTGKTHIVSDVRRDAISCKVVVLPFWLRCSVFRNTATEKDEFGYFYSDLSAAAINVPVAFHGPEKASLPIGTDVRRGDFLAVPAIGERYLVQGVATASPPGLCIVQMAKQTLAVTATA